MKGLKITIIGAGSTYTPELIDGFIKRKDQLKIDSFYLMDIDRKKLQIVGDLAGRMLVRNGINSRLVLTENLDEAIEGADFVMAQVRVGGLDARIQDEKIPLKYNLLGQETTGIGGFMKGMRTIPVIMEVARKIKQLAPDAWLINFSNPSGLVAEAVLNNMNIKMVGLCNNPINMIKNAKEMLPEGTKNFDYDYVGINHLSWITAIYADGKDIMDNLLKTGFESSTPANITKLEHDKELLKITGGIPCGYLNYFFYRDKMIKECKEVEKSRGEVCKDIEVELLELYQDPEINEKPAVLEKRGGALYSEAAVSIVDAIVNDKNEIHVANVRNNGAFKFMDDNDVVEVKCLINKDGLKTIPLEGFDNQYIIGLMKAVKAYEKLAAKAGLSGDYGAALAALMVHPLIGDYYRAKDALDEMLKANRTYLTQFFGEGNS